MRLHMPCMTCLRENVSDSGSMSVELRDDGLYAVTCHRSHHTVVMLQQQKFQVLFDIGAMGLVDGYPREFVLTTASALERFFEYYVRVVSLKHGIEHAVFDDGWKIVSHQSERQFGAFLFVYLLENKKPVSPWIADERPKLPGATSWTAFRNKVAHDGYIPSRAEAVAYCDLVYQWIYRIIGELREGCASAMDRVSIESLLRLHERSKGLEGAPSTNPATIDIPTLIKLGGSASNFEEALARLEKYRHWLYETP